MVSAYAVLLCDQFHREGAASRRVFMIHGPYVLRGCSLVPRVRRSRLLVMLSSAGFLFFNINKYDAHTPVDLLHFSYGIYE